MIPGEEQLEPQVTHTAQMLRPWRSQSLTPDG